MNKLQFSIFRNRVIRPLMLFLMAVVLSSGLSSCGYNTMVQKQEQVDQSWAQVQNVYKRRADLIPNLVATVKGAADFEKETLTAVMEARAKATSVQLSAKDLTPENLETYQKAQSGLSGALARLMVVSENYPQLKANQNFLDLQAQLEGTENRITVERQKFNEAVQDYNTTIRQFPNNMTAGWFNFEKKAYFQAEPGAENAPTVEFGK